MQRHDRQARPVDATGQVEPHAPLSNAVLLFKAVPQLGLLFANAKSVPKTHMVNDTTVRCVCGWATIVIDGELVECDGRCGRHFLRVRDRVRAARLGSTINVDADRAA